jgi:rhamnosyltransferase
VTPPLSIILLTLNGGARFAETLAAIFNQHGGGTEPEVLVIDSGSRDNTLETARQYPVTVHRIPPNEFGHGRTRNLGARLARGDWLIYLSQDAVPAHHHWLQNLTRHLERPEVAAAFGRQLSPAGLGPIETFFLEQTYPDRAFEHQPAGAGPASIRRIFFSNVNSAIKKSVWERHPFPEVVMSEDQAFARAALQSGGHIVYDPAAGVFHGHHYTLPQLFRRNFDSGYSLRTITGDRWRDVARMGLHYVWTETRYLASRGHWPYIPYAWLYEGVKSAGFALGRMGQRLPAAWRPHLSLHTRYWSQEK